MCKRQSKFQSRRSVEFSRMAKGCSTGRLLATDKDQKSLNRQEKSVMSTGEPVATEYQGCSENPETPEDSEPTRGIWPHHFRISPHYVHHMEKVFSIVRKIYDRKPTDDLKDLDVNTATCVCSCLSHIKLQFILDEILYKTHDLSSINLRCLWSNYSGQLRR